MTREITYVLKVVIYFLSFISKKFTNPFAKSSVDSWGGNGILVALFNSEFVIRKSSL